MTCIPTYLWEGNETTPETVQQSAHDEVGCNDGHNDETEEHKNRDGAKDTSRLPPPLRQCFGDAGYSGPEYHDEQPTTGGPTDNPAIDI
ncbi:hypothetical protein GCM10022627_26860 [Haloarcula argentinensis]|uniref:Uncharacterized protein n=1 Tax=Haloarcula argentinensis TaxID=43776 RepID=A0A830FNT2_HALAR|nr:hypothetical protein GCM10009006_23220 [Haloarcula argentinensis]